MPYAINSRALTSEKPCIDKEFHAPLILESLTFRMQDSGQYSINTEKASRLQLKLSIKKLRKRYADSGIMKKNKMTEQPIMCENDLNLCNSAKG